MQQSKSRAKRYTREVRNLCDNVTKLKQNQHLNYLITKLAAKVIQTLLIKNIKQH